MEEWKVIKGYEGLYQVSSYGRVKSLERDIIRGRGGVCHLPERILKGNKLKNGYVQFALCKDGKMFYYNAHRLVAQAFLPNPDNLPQVNHIDEDKANNCVNNLEWCTNKYNVNYGTARDRMKEKLSRPILQLTLDGKLVKEWPSAKEASKQLGFNLGHICNCCKGGYYQNNKWYNSVQHKGFKWQYA